MEREGRGFKHSGLGILAENVYIKAPNKQLGILQLSGRSEANFGASEGSNVAYRERTGTDC